MTTVMFSNVETSRLGFVSKNTVSERGIMVLNNTTYSSTVVRASTIMHCKHYNTIIMNFTTREHRFGIGTNLPYANLGLLPYRDIIIPVYSVVQVGRFLLLVFDVPFINIIRPLKCPSVCLS